MGRRRFYEDSFKPLLIVLGRIYFNVVKKASLKKIRKKWNYLIRTRNCLGFCHKFSATKDVDKPSKNQMIQGKTNQRPFVYQDFWGKGTYEMYNKGVNPPQNLSSISMTSRILFPHCRTEITSNCPQFLNHGSILWDQTRKQWLGRERRVNQTSELRGPRLSWNATYDSLLRTTKPFPHPIPLSEMVDFLVDIWEQEGLYDYV